MKSRSLIITLFSLLFQLNAQSRIISGIVKSDMGEALHEVTIIVNGTDKSTLSDCKGKFKIRAELGDTLFISKEGYKIGKIEIKKRWRNKIILSFDYAKFRDNVKRDTAFYKSFFPTTGQPLFIIDGRHYEGEYYLARKNKLTEDDILSIKIITGEKATLLGRCARNGVVWIRTKCRYISNLEIE